METIRAGLADTINELNKLLRKTRDPEEEQQIRKLRRLGFALFEDVLEQEIDNRTLEFREAIEALDRARGAAVAAREGLERVAEAINRAAQAVRAVDAVVKRGLGLMA